MIRRPPWAETDELLFKQTAQGAQCRGNAVIAVAQLYFHSRDKGINAAVGQIDARQIFQSLNGVVFEVFQKGRVSLQFFHNFVDNFADIHRLILLDGGAAGGVLADALDAVCAAALALIALGSGDDFAVAGL